MNILIEKTQKIETLSLIDPKTGIDYIADFIGQYIDTMDEFCWDDENNAYICTKESFLWWSKVVADNQALEYRIHYLKEKHGYEAVETVINNAGSVDLDDQANNLNDALDSAFQCGNSDIL